ncbi:MAG: hypothetical protein GVY31_14755 [Alphaproteobacteria bacterium]|jgi:predicted DNA-binding transcriptional regulator AlpA|nr:hypothetical protein [Alphaproteobacteria bacterium]
MTHGLLFIRISNPERNNSLSRAAVRHGRLRAEKEPLMSRMQRLVNLAETADFLSVSRVTPYRIQNRNPRFPLPLHLSPGCARRREDQIQAHIQRLTPTMSNDRE